LTYAQLVLIPASLAKSMLDNGDRIEFAGAVLLTSAVSWFGYTDSDEALARALRNCKSSGVFLIDENFSEAGKSSVRVALKIGFDHLRILSVAHAFPE
jgi:hypothetical protein